LCLSYLLRFREYKIKKQKMLTNSTLVVRITRPLISYREMLHELSGAYLKVLHIFLRDMSKKLLLHLLYFPKFKKNVKNITKITHIHQILYRFFKQLYQKELSYLLC
jgi:hypothetical protein